MSQAKVANVGRVCPKEHKSDSACAPEGITRQIQEQSAKYGVDAGVSGYAALTRPTMLSKDWQKTDLGALFELKYGKALPAQARDGIGFPVFGSNGVVGKHSKPTVAENGIIIGRKGSYGEVHISTGPFSPIDTTYFIDEFFNQPIRYWFYQLKHLPLTEFNRATAIPGLNREDAYSLEVSLPSLAEQQQIAAKLDELLTQVDTLKTRLDAIPKILKRFRQSVLAAAVSGKLTEDWRNKKDNYEPVEMLNWKWGLVPSDWEVFYYSDLVQSRLGKMLDKAKNTGVPTRYLGNINVRWFDFDLTNLQEIFVSDKEQIELMVKVGDVLICEGGEPGRCAIWKTESEEPIIFQKALHKACVGKKIIPEWLVYNLKNDCDNKSIEQLFTGTTIKHLTGKALRKYPLRIPSIEEQTEIVKRVEQLFAYADQIEQRVKDAQARVNHLTQSILAKAFRGELTADWRAQNPALISGENSAEALLAKIKAEREADSAKKNTRRVKA